MIKQLILYLILLNTCLVIVPAQEVITGLQSNCPVTETYNKQERRKGGAVPDTLEIPFFDDFSGHSVVPDNTKWLDDYVFVNNTYSDRQITSGIATFDALSNTGKLYESASTTGFQADQLTSLPVNLNYDPSQNIWLSFLYQPAGLSDPPEVNDSLTLEFLAPEENIWYSVWKADGDTNQAFKTVILKIDETRFLKKGFQFRFINYASISSNLSDPSMIGNCDIWNIDYVVLDKNRDAGDTIFKDVAFRLPLRSLLKNHESMPWKQFKQINLSEMGNSIATHYRNNDTIVRNVTSNFEIWDVDKDIESESFTTGAENIDPLMNIDKNVNLIYNFYNPNTLNYDSAFFKITCSLKTDEFDPKGNDTLVYYQAFKNYFAFDDGSSEAGYGINGLGSRNAMAAYRFTSFIADTLRAIRICFNNSYMNANKRAFDLMVWDNNNGVPGNVIFAKEEVMVEQGEDINGFYTYKIPEGIVLNNIFYVGWKQRSETFLNAGIDINTPHAGKQFYWLNGEWRQSQIDGSLMIRPVVGYPLTVTSIDDTYYRNKNKVIVWPNPSTDYIKLNIGEVQLSGQSYITVIDLSGRELLRVPFSEQIDISRLHEGVYIIITSINGRPIGYNRIIKTR